MIKLFVLLACVASLGAMISCEKEQSSISDEKSQSLIIGEWECVSMNEDFDDGFAWPGWRYNYTSDDALFITLPNGGDGYAQGETIAFLYAISNGKLVVVGEESFSFNIETLDNNSLKISEMRWRWNESTGTEYTEKVYATFKRIK